MGANNKARRKILLTSACLVLVMALGVGALIAFTPLGIALRQNPGSFDRGHFDAVVTQVRSMSLVAGEEVQLRLDDPSDPTSLRLFKPGETFHRGEGAGNVWASVDPDGMLKVVIETRDRGHAGEYGFAYSDVPLTPQPFGGGWLMIDVPGHINLVQPKMKIDDHWWEVLYNLG